MFGHVLGSDQLATLILTIITHINQTRTRFYTTPQRASVLHYAKVMPTFSDHLREK